MKSRSKTLIEFALVLLALPAVANAWWKDDWKQRTQVTFNTSAAGVQTQGVVSGMAIPVRLHSGNFDFAGAKQDGSDLRVVAGDDKTPLKFWLERFDGLNELALLWVQVPSVLPATDKNTLYIYAGNPKAEADPVNAAVFDPATIAAFHFSEKDGPAADQTGAVESREGVAREPNGLLGQSARITGTAIHWSTTEPLKSARDSLTVAEWIKPDAPAGAGSVYHQGNLTIGLAAGAAVAQIGAVKVSGGQVAPGTWTQLVLTIGAGKATLYLNGAQVGQGDLAAPAPVEGDIEVGEGYQGLVDEIQISHAVRSAEWIKLAYAAQSADARLIASKTQAGDEGDSGSSGGYFGILFKSLTPDAWVVIGILMVMFMIAAVVMVTKAIYVNRTENANRRFLSAFRESGDVLKLSGTANSEQFRDSPLYRLFAAGLRELVKRDVGTNSKALSGPSLDAVKAAVDADSVREGHKLNAQMVLLTIAISGGPFLGLLGTVIGVMITFASIAAAGDVNVNAIAPGIAAALLATVAGLSVAIPSLFGYNYLASRIKNITSEMHIFIDEFVTRVAETYGAR